MKQHGRAYRLLADLKRAELRSCLQQLEQQLDRQSALIAGSATGETLLAAEFASILRDRGNESGVYRLDPYIDKERQKRRECDQHVENLAKKIEKTHLQLLEHFRETKRFEKLSKREAAQRKYVTGKANDAAASETVLIRYERKASSSDTRL